MDKGVWIFKFLNSGLHLSLNEGRFPNVCLIANRSRLFFYLAVRFFRFEPLRIVFEKRAA